MDKTIEQQAREYLVYKLTQMAEAGPLGFDAKTIREAARALAQKPAIGEEIMVNAAHDVYTLPLQPSGLSSGPRFVVHVPGPEERPQKAVVAWARPVYAKPVGAEAVEGEVVDIEFHLRPEKPEGEGWYPLVVADTGNSAAPLPRINVKCETTDNGITGAAFLKVIRVEQEDDGSLTAVIDHWPQQVVHPAITFCDNCGCDWLDNGLNPVDCPYCKWTALKTENERLAGALECLIIGACAVAVPHKGERAVLQDAVNIARAAVAAYRKGGAQ